jgi:HK97 family phage major capsid protein
MTTLEQELARVNRAIADLDGQIERDNAAARRFVARNRAEDEPAAADLVARRRASRRELADLVARRAALSVIADEDRQYIERAREVHPVHPTRPGAAHEMRLDGRTAHSTAADAGWRRASDGRAAAVERGQSFRDHDVVAELAERMAAAERPITETYGGVGQLIRALSTTGASAVIPTTWQAQIIDRARNYAAVLQAGTQIIPMDSKVVQVGRLTTDPSSAFRAEGTPITASDPAFDSVTLTATTLSCLTVASMEYLQDAIGADQVVEDAIGKSMALALDLACLYGSVTAGAEVGTALPAGGLPSPPNPRGILGNLLANLPTNVLGAATNGTAQTPATPWNEILSLIYTPRRANETPNALLWPTRLHQAYDQMYDAQNRPLPTPDTVAAMERIETNQLASGMTQGTGTLMCDAVCGDFGQALLGQRLDFTVRILSERYAEAGQVGIVSHWRGDFQLARPGAFAFFRYLKGA